MRASPLPRALPCRHAVRSLGPDERIAFIKIDAEGAELSIIRGGLRVIRRCRPIIVFEMATTTTPYYGVGPDDIFNVIVEELDMHLSTMARWIQGAAPYTLGRFKKDFRRMNEFFFIAY